MATETISRRFSRRQFLQSTAIFGLATAAAACAAPMAAPGTSSSGAAPAQAEIELSWVTPAAVGLERTMYENFAEVPKR